MKRLYDIAKRCLVATAVVCFVLVRKPKAILIYGVVVLLIPIVLLSLWINNRSSPYRLLEELYVANLSGADPQIFDASYFDKVGAEYKEASKQVSSINYISGLTLLVLSCVVFGLVNDVSIVGVTVHLNKCIPLALLAIAALQVAISFLSIRVATQEAILRADARLRAGASSSLYLAKWGLVDKGKPVPATNIEATKIGFAFGDAAQLASLKSVLRLANVLLVVYAAYVIIFLLVVFVHEIFHPRLPVALAYPMLLAAFILYFTAFKANIAFSYGIIKDRNFLPELWRSATSDSARLATILHRLVNAQTSQTP